MQSKKSGQRPPNAARLFKVYFEQFSVVQKKIDKQSLSIFVKGL
jgi:hypothetical protein